MSVIIGWEPPNEPPIKCATWECRTCLHPIYEHATRIEPNSGIRMYASCKRDDCDCRVGQNHVYPRGRIST